MGKSGEEKRREEKKMLGMKMVRDDEENGEDVEEGRKRGKIQDGKKKVGGTR